MNENPVEFLKTHKAVAIGGVAAVILLGVYLYVRRGSSNTGGSTGYTTTGAGQYLVPIGNVDTTSGGGSGSAAGPDPYGTIPTTNPTPAPTAAGSTSSAPGGSLNKPGQLTPHQKHLLALAHRQHLAAVKHRTVHRPTPIRGGIPAGGHAPTTVRKPPVVTLPIVRPTQIKHN